jgi:hypothetical protein
MRCPVWIEEMARCGVMGEVGMVVEGKERVGSVSKERVDAHG